MRSRLVVPVVPGWLGCKKQPEQPKTKPVDFSKVRKFYTRLVLTPKIELPGCKNTTKTTEQPVVNSVVVPPLL